MRRTLASSIDTNKTKDNLGRELYGSESLLGDQKGDGDGRRRGLVAHWGGGWVAMFPLRRPSQGREQGSWVGQGMGWQGPSRAAQPRSDSTRGACRVLRTVSAMLVLVVTPCLHRRRMMVSGVTREKVCMGVPPRICTLAGRLQAYSVCSGRGWVSPVALLPYVHVQSRKSVQCVHDA